mmetsp:Transcript_37253/g.33436  ORF Transcript_37253/g.33436 Transcript_37253/m.33436 type:complete len:99 (+) Transcript_37253:886-1182(+)
MCNNAGHRFVKSFITEFEKYNGEATDLYKEVLDGIYELCVKEIAILLPTKAIFIIVGFMEQPDYKEQMIEEIKKVKHLLKNLKGAGVEIIKKHLKESK